jgi:hypothetical protein
MELIHRPFFITRFGSSYPWGGVAVTDNFFGTQDWADRPQPLYGETGTVRGTGHRVVHAGAIGTNGFSLVDPLARAVIKAQTTETL